MHGHEQKILKADNANICKAIFSVSPNEILKKLKYYYEKPM